ncbi:hypothetical protein K466DRAFT_595994 [Polyporus arcularius HHB13444]|uniref:DUF6534 domain-containing protein n=1 Tax=Polyporus arcularius HHB13444 TaxID=1314778 RepID=A0A5C3PT71_9APHY|nr:hypothetical protein K466DRAFT_595994 [Polyporus arcularius HHB13444]
MSTPSADPLVSLFAENRVQVPRLDASFGAILVGTYVSLVLYGLTVHQAFRYFRIYREDVPRLKYLVTTLLLADTVYLVLCMHACYFYLIKNYFKPLALVNGTWSLRLMPPVSGLIVILSQSFYSRRAALMGSWYKTLVSVVTVLILGEIGFTIGGTFEAFSLKTFEHWKQMTWLSASAWVFAVVVESLLSTTLIIVLRKSRTGFKRTDSVLDILTGYTINTGLLTGTASLVCLVFALAAPQNLIYIGCNMGTTMLYSNSTLAVLNSRKFLAQRALGGLDPTGPEFDWSGMQVSNHMEELGANEQQASSPPFPHQPRTTIRSTVESVIHIRNGAGRTAFGEVSLSGIDESEAGSSPSKPKPARLAE